MTPPSHRWPPNLTAHAESFDPAGTFKVPTVERGRSLRPKAGLERKQEAVGRADLVVVGNGIAGCIAAIETRRFAPGARIVIVTEQSHPTINTPALKQFGAGRLQLDQLMAYPAGTEQRFDIRVVHQRATEIDPSNHRLCLADGSLIQYRSLLLATGANATHLADNTPGRDFDGVMTLHSLSDYLDLRRRLPMAEAAVVIGGGYHAAETVMLLRHQHIKVTWLLRGRGLLPRQLDLGASELLLRQIRRQGVEVQRETEVAGIVGRMGVVAGVVTTGGAYIPGDLVIAAIGTAPDVALARGTGIQAQVNHGFRVNEHLQTTVRDVFAAGASAAVQDPQTRQYDARGQWYFAFQQGRVAAAEITGVQITEEMILGAVGNFWHATQFDRLSVLVAGAPMLTEHDHRDNEVLTNGSNAFFRRIVVRHGHLVGFLAVGATPPPGLSIKRLIDERINIEEIKRKLLTEDFDIRSFFTQRRLHALAIGNTAAIPKPVMEVTQAIQI